MNAATFRLNYNVTAQFAEHCKHHGSDIAVIAPDIDAHLHVAKETHYTFADINALAAQYQRGLAEAGFRKGDRIILLMPITVELYGAMLAMMGMGIATVFLDPGIGLKKILAALGDSRAKAILSIDKLLKYRWFIPPLWRMKKYSADKVGWGVKPFSSLKVNTDQPFVAVHQEATDHQFITYTSGSTGRAKGADRNAENIYQQFELIKACWSCTPDVVDFPSFPMFGIFNLCMGSRTVIPAVDFARVGEQNSAEIVAQIQRHQVTRMSGAPRFMGRLTDHAHAQGITLPSVKNIALGGASVTREFCTRMLEVFPNADMKMAYGSTEAAPMAFVDLAILRDAQGPGSLVGAPAPGVTVKVVNLPSAEMRFGPEGPAPYECASNEVGEIIVNGPHVVQGYVDNPVANATTKIEDPQRSRWHRTGDMGYFDEKGQLWLTGRQSDVVTWQGKPYQPYVIEQQFDALEDVTRSALIQAAPEQAVTLAIEARGPSIDRARLQATMQACCIEFARLQLIDSIPVDDRHNSKIDRIKLRKTLCR